MESVTISDESSREKQARKLCILLKTITEETALRLIDDFGGDKEALDFVMNGDQQAVQDYLKKDPHYGKSMTIDAQFVASELDTEIGTTIRQFSCSDCRRAWWMKVPIKKQVSCCKKCNKKYDPIPRHNEWGIGKFVCDCGNVFAGFGEMSVTSSECYKCRKMVPIKHMLKPRRNRSRKSNAPHSCNGVDCFSRDCLIHKRIPRSGGVNGTGTSDDSPVCVHPKTGQKILTYSEPHKSTGSTITTLLRQNSLDSFEEGRMCDIQEFD